MGSEMKRIAFVALGFVWGLLVTGASFYIFNRINWPKPSSPSAGCGEPCGSHAGLVATMLFILLWPSIVFAALNAFSYKRWSQRKWTVSFAAVTLLAVLFHLATYVMPMLGPSA
ncbi:Transmembrane protein [Burkholderia sp. IT-111MI5]